MGSSSAKKDLRTMAYSKLNKSLPYASARKKENGVLGFVNSNVASMWKGVVISLAH